MARSSAHAGTESSPYGDTWVYESIIGALPGIELSDTEAIALQLGLFEVAVIVLSIGYGIESAILPGTVAVFEAAVGSGAMQRLGRGTRELDLPQSYRQFLFGSSIEVVLGVLAFVALVTHLFVFDPRGTGMTIIESFLGENPPILVVYLTLLILWDLCYRIGTSWWAAVVALWRSWRYEFDSETAGKLRRLDALNAGFGLTQVAMVPFVIDRPVLLTAVGGHVIAVIGVSLAALVTLDEIDVSTA
jgi:hypothetical protein